MAVVKYDRMDRPKPFGVKWTVDGQRKFKFFEKATLRNEYMAKLIKQDKKEGRSILELSAAEAVVMRRCVDMLGNAEKVLSACQELRERENIIEIDGAAAAKQYLDEKSKLGRDDNYYRAIRNILGKLIARFSGNTVGWKDVDARKWGFELSDLYKPVTVKNHIKSSSAFCNWCVERKYMRYNIFKKVPLPEVIRDEVEFLSVGDMRRLMECVVERYPECVAYLALNGFGGIRSSACSRLKMSSIDFDKRGILITADIAKNKRRVYLDGYEDNLWQWLEWARKNARHGFELSKRIWDEYRGKLARIAGVRIPHNGLRHSFCTYHVALYGDAGKTATLLTHRGNVSILYEHYRGNASREEAKEYFGILPGRS